MNLLRHFWEACWRRPTGRNRRVIVLVLLGFDWRRAEQYLDEGLFHYLPMFADFGARLQLQDEKAGDLEALSELLRAAGTQTVVLSAADADPDFDSVCAADRNQQDRLFALLNRRRAGVVIAGFDMLARVRQATGMHRLLDDPLILRDVYARMDEHVGKALSFVDDGTVLVVAIPSHTWPSPPGCGVERWEIFVSQALPALETRTASLFELISQFVESTTE